jgi:hypothetical protein
MGYEVHVVRRDRVLWWRFVRLSFLARTPRLYDRPLGLALLLLSST